MSSISFEIIDLKDSERWMSILNTIESYDFYHTPDFHRLDESGESLLLSFKTSSYQLAFPIIIREIENSDFCDCTSVYGYAGPLQTEARAADYKPAIKLLEDFYTKKNIISSFSRLHPLINNQELFLEKFGSVEELNTTVSIDLTLPEEYQQLNYSKSTKRHIKNAIKNEVVIRPSDNENDLSRFIDIYYENMERVKASSYYFFPEKYFEKFLKSKNFYSYLFLAEKDQQIISGALITVCNGIMQYHLGCTKKEYLKFTPLKLIFNEVRKFGVQNGNTIFHLGGGVGGQNDTLFQFKSGFSNQYHQFKVWKRIINNIAYSELVAEKFGNNIPDSKYFPLYRLSL